MLQLEASAFAAFQHLQELRNEAAGLQPQAIEAPRWHARRSGSRAKACSNCTQSRASSQGSKSKLRMGLASDFGMFLRSETSEI